jgi:hypothetical protein
MLRDPRRRPRSATAAAIRPPGRLAVTDPRRCPRTVTMAPSPGDRGRSAGRHARQRPRRPRCRHRRQVTRNLRDGISRRPARGSQPAATRRRQRVQRKPEKQSDARGRLADRLRHGNGRVRRACAGAHPRDATRRAPGPVMSASQRRGSCRRSPRPCAGRSPAGAAARGDDPLNQEGSPVQVPITVEPPAGRFTARAVST